MLKLFEGAGIELEYMIVDAERLNVLPICDKVLAEEAGEIVSEVELGEINWSNELVLHVIELKTGGPAKSLTKLPALFNDHVVRVNTILAGMGARLMPTAMHPWMDPHKETQLWPHEYSAVYETFNRIFDCRGHGWSNLQSMHINLPFSGDEEFGRLHAAIRLILPILPALATSSPFMDGKVGRHLDNRLAAYRNNCNRVPSVAGHIIPERAFTVADYQHKILKRIYADLAPLDPEGVLADEWVNARGAIARFVRDTIEIRVIDVQECPSADLAIASLTIAVLKLLVSERWGALKAQQSWEAEQLATILNATIHDADAATIDYIDYARALGWRGAKGPTAGELWRHLAAEVAEADPLALEHCASELETLLHHGPLARRILRALGKRPTHDRLEEVYGQLCECLDAGQMFIS